MENIDISNLDKAEVLKALHDNSRPKGMGFLHYNPPDMPIEEARTLVAEHTYFDYLKGRVMKVDIGGDELRPGLYDRDNGEGAALAALTPLINATTD